MRKLLLILLLFLFSNCDAQILNNNVLLTDDRPIIVSVETLSNISVSYNTAFVDITFPSTVDVLLSNGLTVPLSVTWLEGLYSPIGVGEQPISGNIITPNNIYNIFEIQAAVIVVVAPEIIVEFLTVTGSNTYTWLSGVDSIYVEAGGGGGSGSGVGGAAARGWGGGGGAYSSSWLYRPNDSQDSYFIAAAVACPIPAGSNVDGTDGQDTWFRHVDTLFAEGGLKGATTTSGVGGRISEGKGTTLYAGGNGSPVQASSRSAAGGGAAGSLGNGGNAPNGSGSTSAPGGTGTGEHGGNGAAGSSGVGANGSIYGGAGSGARSTDATNRRGGSGEQGYLKLTYTGANEYPPEPGDAYVYLHAGQSEMVGGSTTVNPPSLLQNELLSKIYVNTTVGFENLEWNVNNQASVTNSFSAELSFGYEMTLTDTNVYVVKRAQSGTSMFLNWNVDNNSIGRSSIATLLQAMNILRDQGKDVKFMGVMWMQGLGDMGTNNPEYPNGAAAVESAYKSQFTAWYKYLIDQLEDDGFSTADCRLVVALTDYAYCTVPLYQSSIVDAQEDVALNFRTDNPSYASKCLDGFTFTTADITRSADCVHFNNTGSVTLGERFADIFDAYIPN